MMLFMWPISSEYCHFRNISVHVNVVIVTYIQFLWSGFVSLHRCVELIICEQMNKYRVRLKDISSLEFAENKAKCRLTLIRRSMVRSDNKYNSSHFSLKWITCLRRLIAKLTWLSHPQNSFSAVPFLISFFVSCFYPLQILLPNLSFPLPRNPY